MKTTIREEKPSSIIEMGKYPVYTRQLRRYGELIADITIMPLDNCGHHEIRIQPYINSEKLNILILEAITE